MKDADAASSGGFEDRADVGVEVSAPGSGWKPLVTLRKMTQGHRARSEPLLVGDTSRSDPDHPREPQQVRPDAGIQVQPKLAEMGCDHSATQQIAVGTGLSTRVESTFRIAFRRFKSNRRCSAARLAPMRAERSSRKAANADSDFKGLSTSRTSVRDACIKSRRLDGGVSEPLLERQLAHSRLPHPSSVCVAQGVWCHPRCAKPSAPQARANIYEPGRHRTVVLLASVLDLRQGTAAVRSPRTAVQTCM